MNQKHTLLDKLAKNKIKTFLCFTGGGSKLLSDLMVEGCSRYFAGATTPYHSDVATYLFGEQEKWVSKEYAEKMALSSLESLLCIKEENTPIGMGLTCKLTYTGEREDREHLAYFAIARLTEGGSEVQCYPIRFKTKTREGQEQEISDCVFQHLDRLITLESFGRAVEKLRDILVSPASYPQSVIME